MTNSLCQRCGVRPSTGFLVHLCDPCFDEWEAEVNADPRNPDIGPIDGAIKRKSAGGDVPDDMDAVVVADTDGVLVVANGGTNPRLN